MLTALISPQEYLGTATGGGYKKVTTAGTRVQITATETNITGVIIQAFEDNAGYVAVGGEDVVALNGSTRVCIFMLAPGTSVTVPVRNLALIYLDSTVSGDEVNYFPIKG